MPPPPFSAEAPPVGAGAQGALGSTTTSPRCNAHRQPNSLDDVRVRDVLLVGRGSSQRRLRRARRSSRPSDADAQDASGGGAVDEEAGSFDRLQVYLRKV